MVHVESLVELSQRQTWRRRTSRRCWAAAILLSLAVLPGDALSVPQDSADFTVAAEESDNNEAEVTGTIMLVGNDGSEPDADPVLREELAIDIETIGKQPSEIAEIKIAHMKDGKRVALLRANSADGTFTTPEAEFVFDRSNPGEQRVVVMGRAKDGAVAWKEWNVIGRSNNIELQEGRMWDHFAPLAAGGLETEEERGPLKANVAFGKEHVTVTGNVRDDAGKPIANATVAITSLSTSGSVGMPDRNDPSNAVWGSVDSLLT